VSLKRHGNRAAALSEMAECLKLHPGDSEAQSVMAAWKAEGTQTVARTSTAAAGDADADANPDPLERIVRSFDAAAFKQAGMVVDQIDAARLAALPPPERARKLCGEAKGYLDRGLVLEAERLYQSAIAADNKVAAAHAGLAEVRLRTGDGDGARQQAQEALKLDPSADAYVVMSRVDFAAGKLAEAGSEADEALKLDPANQTALELHRQIQAKTGQKTE
jgi:tetratricopeptide (TPR) repeat protein